MSTPKTYWIEKPGQILLLASAMRQEILDSVSALGSCSIAELAQELGVAADALYYHVRKLVESGLLIEQGARVTSRRDEIVYTLPGQYMNLKYQPENAENVGAINKVISAMMRMAERDFRNGFTPDLAVIDDGIRNLWGARQKAWLTEEDLKEVNQLLERLQEIFHQSKQPGDRKLYTLTWVIAPKKAQAKRRETRSGKDKG